MSSLCFIQSSSSDTRNGYNDSRHFADESSNDPGLLSAHAVPSDTPGYFRCCLTSDNHLPTWVWVDKFVHSNNNSESRVYRQLGHCLETLLVIPVANRGFRLSDASIVSSAALLVDAEHQLFGLVCHFIKYDYPHPRNLPRYISSRNWRIRYYQLVDRTDKAVRLIQRGFRQRRELYRFRRTFAQSHIRSTTLLADCLKDIVLGYYNN